MSREPGQVFPKRVNINCQQICRIKGTKQIFKLLNVHENTILIDLTFLCRIYIWNYLSHHLKIPSYHSTCFIHGDGNNAQKLSLS